MTLLAPQLTSAANGHLILSLEEAPDNLWSVLLTHLWRLGGLKVEHDGMVHGFDTVIGPHVQLGPALLKSGWDHWSGYYLLSESPDGDALLRQLYAWLLDQT